MAKRIPMTSVKQQRFFVRVPVKQVANFRTLCNDQGIPCYAQGMGVLHPDMQLSDLTVGIGLNQICASYLITIPENVTKGLELLMREFGGSASKVEDDKS